MKTFTSPNLLLTIMCILTLNFQLIAQTNSTTGYAFWNPEMQEIAMSGSTESWVLLKSTFQVSNNNFLNEHKTALGLGANDWMVFIKPLM